MLLFNCSPVDGGRVSHELMSETSLQVVGLAKCVIEVNLFEFILQIKINLNMKPFCELHIGKCYTHILFLYNAQIKFCPLHTKKLLLTTVPQSLLLYIF